MFICIGLCSGGRLLWCFELVLTLGVSCWCGVCVIIYYIISYYIIHILYYYYTLLLLYIILYIILYITIIIYYIIIYHIIIYLILYSISLLFPSSVPISSIPPPPISPSPLPPLPSFFYSSPPHPLPSLLPFSSSDLIFSFPSSHSKYTCRVFHLLIYILPAFQNNSTPHVLSEWMVEWCSFKVCGVRLCFDPACFIGVDG